MPRTIEPHKWDHWEDIERGLYDSVYVTKFSKNKEVIGLYDVEEYLVTLEKLLIEAHDKMDDDNAKVALGSYCRWCSGAGYDASGLIHSEDCILVKIREEFND